MVTITKYTLAESEELAVFWLTKNGIDSMIEGFDTLELIKEYVQRFSEINKIPLSCKNIYKVTVNVGITSSKAEKVE